MNGEKLSEKNIYRQKKKNGGGVGGAPFGFQSEIATNSC